MQSIFGYGRFVLLCLTLRGRTTSGKFPSLRAREIFRAGAIPAVVQSAPELHLSDEGNTARIQMVKSADDDLIPPETLTWLPVARHLIR